MDLRLLSRPLLCVLVVLLLLTPALVRAEAPLPASEVPAPLAPWLSWVLYGEADPACPYVAASDARQCAWPGQLQLAVTAEGARFEAAVEIWAAGTVPLPGREAQWPEAVTVDGTPAVVIAQGGAPAVALEPGAHRISGAFSWTRPPETLQVPASIGLLALTLDGKPVLAPQRTADGELWLQAPSVAAGDAQSDALRLLVFRRVIDDQPLQVETVLDFDVSGTQREIVFDGAQLPHGIPMSVGSDLPARLDQDGRLRVQVRPGHWRVQVTTRQPGPVTALERPAGGAHWPAEELWVFEARPALRLVELSGGTAVDPRQTSLPAEWHAFPAFRLQAGEQLAFAVLRRGDPMPAPDQLNLQRQIWLDFDGGGYTVQDSISGLMTRGWRLDAGAALAPGRVLLNGEPQFITELDGRRGVELRRGTVDLRADSRIESPTALNAVGWAQDFNSVQATLHLPPGWRLWSARGVDQLPDTWLQRWTLLDLFLVFIIALTCARLWSWPLGALSLLTLALCWHEPAAPRQIWLHVLASIALVRVLPAGRLRALVGAYRHVALLTLVVVTVAFAIDQLRLGLYPQLAQPWRMVGQASSEPTAAAGAVQEAVVAQATNEVASDRVRRVSPAPMAKMEADAGVAAHSLSSSDYSVQREYDPQANIQTGPGLPGWQWQQAQLGWRGPVAADQPLALNLLSPRVNLLLAVARVLCLFALIGLVLRASFASGARVRAATMLLLMALGGAGGAQAAADAPSPELLDELKRRVLLAPECAPDCASIPRLQATLADQRLQLRLEIHTRTALGVPLPGRAEHWLPETVLVDGEPANGLRRDKQGELLLALPAGVHNVLLEGAVPRRASFQLPLPLPAQRAAVSADGWAVDGIDADSAYATQLIFTRQQQAGVAQITEQASALPPFFTLERTLQLGLEWRVHNRLTRVTPPGVGAALSIPLLAGEAVTTPDIKATGGQVALDIVADEMVREWNSVLARGETLTLTAPEATAWHEIWRADISPIWHAALDGIPVVHHQSVGGEWLPTWRPWPGETAGIRLSRPAGVPGRTLTIDRSELRLMPGQRASDGVLSFTARSSQGGRHKLSLPVGAALQSVTINGVPQPIRQAERLVSLPIVPGEQQIELSWRSADTVTTRWQTPAFDLGTDSVNAALQVVVPGDRWVLAAGGPQLGPAVLFWGTLIVIVAVAGVLGRLKLAPVSTLQWGLLGVGLTQTSVLSAVLIVGWLLALGVRNRVPAELPKWQFNLLQLALAALTLTALSLLFEAIRQGLLGVPSMQIAGNGSTASELYWFQDRATANFPQAWVVSVSIWFYRGLMLAWALWLAFALLGWLRWGWQHFARDGVWRRVNLLSGKSRVTVSEPPAPAA